MVLHVREGQNCHFTSHLLLLNCGEDGAGGAWRPLLRRRVRGLFRRRWSWRGRLLAMKREGQGWLRLFLSRPSIPVPLVSLSQTLAATAGSSPSHLLCVGRLDPGRFQPHPPQPATPASSDERARACSSLATRIRRWWPPPTSS
jgi:hypothetical protein